MTAYTVYGTIVTVLDTGLNSLANGSRAISAGQTNTAGDLWADLELNASFGSAPTANTVVDAYLLPSVDGTNYPDGSSSITPSGSLLVGSFVLRNNATQRQVIRGVQLPPQGALYTVLVVNNAGVSFSASGSTVKVRPYRTE
jgi:hypothetical protein